MSARRRGLTPEDRRLWEEVAATATPLRPALRSDAAPDPARVLPRPDPPMGFLPAPHPDRGRPLMDRSRFEKLRRGRTEPEARLDLHGMTSERAHAALSHFVLAAYEGGLRLVLVITGKGREDGTGRHGILRHSLPHWLAAPPLVGLILAVTPAHHRHGGAGAFYVCLRRRR